MRYFNYLDNRNELGEGYFICKQIIADVLKIDGSLLTLEERKIVNRCKEELILLDKELGDSYYAIDDAILNDLLAKDAVEYCFAHNRYPEGCSKIGEKINKIFKRIFEIEDEIGVIIANMWCRIITPFDKINNGDSFVTIGHSGYGYINLPNSKYYRSNEYENTSSISCSIFTDKIMNCFNSNIVMLFDINPDSLIAALAFDTATRKVENRKDIKSLRQIKDNSFISAGYSLISRNYEAAVKTKTPDSVINSILTKEKELLTGNGVVSEAIIDKRYATAKGLLLFSSGCDFLFLEYLEILKMKRDYNLDFKVINRSLYRKKCGLPPFLENEIRSMHQSYQSIPDTILNFNMSYDELESLLAAYINEVLIPLKLDLSVEKLQLEFIDSLKQSYKDKQSTYK